jgi:cytochrome b subunit of formate dehydrogenase
VGTCGKCHAGATASFVSFYPHADPSNRRAYPALHWSLFAMQMLLGGVLGFFGIHTALWLPRSWRNRKVHQNRPLSGKFYRRFDPVSRGIHLTIVITFIGLALTGIPLHYSNTPWAQWLAQTTVFASREVSGGFHRFFAILTFGYAITHIMHLLRSRTRSRESWSSFFLGPDSMVPKGRDFVELWQHFRYFVGMGPRPQFGRWTYWEKFDYWAVFWGIVVIGLSGLMLWFPTFFATFLPGWTLNIAHIIHSEEALLAVSFIFLIHFFHNALRGEKFPMDTMMLTGRISDEEFREEHPREYQRLLDSGRLAEREAPAPTREELAYARVICGVALSLGTIVLLAILISVFFW